MGRAGRGPRNEHPADATEMGVKERSRSEAQMLAASTGISARAWMHAIQKMRSGDSGFLIDYLYASKYLQRNADFGFYCTLFEVGIHSSTFGETSIILSKGGQTGF